jgi:hypothetical protein
MNHKELRPNKPIRNWLGLGVLALFVIGLIRLSGSAQPTAEAEDTAAPSIKAFALSSPISAEIFSPLPPSMESPLQAEILSPLPPTLDSPLPTHAFAAVSETDTAPADGFRLVVLHTNDTWGYLLPCG